MKTIFISHEVGAIVENNGGFDTAPTQWSFRGNDIEVRDEYHSMHELYQHRMALNIALFHAWKQLGFTVMKSKQHSDGSMFDGYFIVMADLPVGQVSYHYKLEHWDLFKIPVVDKTPKYDGHTSLQVFERLVLQT